jgi:hypothetical protein
MIESSNTLEKDHRYPCEFMRDESSSYTVNSGVWYLGHMRMSLFVIPGTKLQALRQECKKQRKGAESKQVCDL